MIGAISQYLDDMTNEERSVFLYCYVLRIPHKEASKRLNINTKATLQICKNLAKYYKTIHIRQEIEEAFSQ